MTGNINYDAFGNTVGSTGSSANSYMYGADSGYRSDGDAGLTYIAARYYDSKIGRFTTRDNYLDQKPYLYCDNDPVNCVDPSGHLTFGDFVTFGNDVFPKASLGKLSFTAVIGTAIEDFSPPHSIGKGIGGTLVGIGTVTVGVGLVVAGSVATAPIIIVGGTIIGTGIAVIGVVHTIRGWLEW